MKHWPFLLAMFLTVGCTAHQPIKTVEYLDLQRFMGQWYVIANIPTFIEKDAYNAVEIYQQNQDGSITTTFRFNKGSYTGEVSEYHPIATVVDSKTNATWEMQFIWPFKADYRVVHINSEYSVTIIGRNKRDYVWLMARSPEIPEADFQLLLEKIREYGYDIKKVQKVPQQHSQSDALAWRT